MSSAIEYVLCGRGAAGIALVAALSGGCGGDESRSPGSGSSAAAPVEAVAASHAPAPSTSAELVRPPPPTPTFASRVFVDVSGSMNGFIHRSERTVSVIQQAIDDSLAAVGRAGPERCTVGETVECAHVPRTNLAYDDPAVYHATASRLDAVLRRAPAPERIDPDHPPAPDWLDDAHVTVLVTDGMQAAASAAGAGVTGRADAVAQACQAAADPDCIAAILEARAVEGFGIWLIHQLLPFEGRHFAEVPLDSRMLALATSHAAEIALDPRFNGVEFDVGRMTTDARNATSAFEYRGVKPLLLVVLSRDVDRGRRTVEGIVSRLRAAPIQPGAMAPTFSTQSVELAPLSPATFSLGALDSAPREDQATLTIEQQREVRLRGTRPGPNPHDVSADVWCGANGALLLYQHFTRTPGAVELPSYVEQTVSFVGPVGSAPAGVGATPAERPAAHAYRVGVNCRALRSNAAAIGYELASTLSLREDEATVGREWWYELSGSDTYRSPERLYGLRNLVLRVLRNRASGKTVHGRLRVTITREE